jgi:formate hydrogenlyase subunit 6/NADH:ubiquinone oxidoreductase subunit I
MTATALQSNRLAILERDGLAQLFEALVRRGYRLIGPTRRDGAIVYDEVTTVADLPAGWTDEQEAGRYRLRRRNDRAIFGYAVGPHSWKRFLHPPQVRLWRAEREATGFHIIEERDDPPPLAFIGVRPCEVAAIHIQDRIFLEGQFVDPHYAARRERAFIVAVNCQQPADTCFCASMKTGPRATSGYDLALTEIINDGQHVFLIETGSPRGEEIVAELPVRLPSEDDERRAREISEATAARLKRQVNTDGLKDLLYRNTENARWDAVAERCLSCANCTLVCPTCFCATVEDVTDLTGESAERLRKWDSCFTMDFSYIHGGSVRASTRSRYRQWLTHKLASWWDQFGTSGCVGCGRCITWCPAAIDLTEEIRALRGSDTV